MRIGKRPPGLVGLVALALLTLICATDSCYEPDFTTAIYQCDVYTCPVGLVCNSDKLCVNFAVDGCTNGGIDSGDNVYLCPGVKNMCQISFKLCDPAPMGLACPIPQGDLAAPPPCKICCPQ